MEDMLPQGWAAAKLGDILEVIRGVTYTKDVATKQPQPGFLPILRATNIGSVLDFDDLVYVPKSFVSENQRLHAGDIVIAASSGSRAVVGKAAQLMTDWLGSFGAFCFGLRPCAEVDARFVSHFLQTKEYRNRVSTLAAGVNINNLRREHIESAPILLPPLPEQRRIVAEIETQFTRLDAAVAALERAQVNLKRYRAAILDAASTGTLVISEADLARSERREYETATVLLNRILGARHRRWSDDQFGGSILENNQPRKSSLTKKYRQPTLPRGASTKLPEGWTWASVDQLAVLVTDGDHNPPKRVPYGVPHLTAKHIRNGKISFEETTYITDEDFEKTRARLEPKAEDLIVTCVGTIGQSAIVPQSVLFSADRNLAAIRPVGIADESRWLKVVLDSPEWQQRMDEVSGSTAQPHLYLGDLRTLPVPLPPLAESQRIIAEVERLSSLVQVLGREVTHGLKRAERLRQSILRKAFSGQLVPQVPDDEPAIELLQHIQQERAAGRSRSRVLQKG